MKVLVVGGGSIGARHLRNLQALGAGALALVEPNALRRAELSRDGVQGFAELDAGLEWGAELALITTPSHLHVEQALAAARRGCHLFVEKPLSHTAEGLAELATEVQARGLITLVGCNMRFHPGPAQVRRLIQAGAIGRVLFARVHTGSYLPGWRPQQDYRFSYSAQAAQGGGCILDCIHEIDLTRWYLGEVDEVFCAAEQLSSMEIDVEDVAMLTCRHSSGAHSQVHLDYVQRTYERGCQIVGEQGSIFWDFRAAQVRLYDAVQDRWEIFDQPEGWQINQMYVDELEHLLGCVRRTEPTTLPIADGLLVMRLALAAKQSARTRCSVPTRSIAL